MKWAALVPLIGGQVIGSEMALGSPPDGLYSYSAFAENDGYCARRYSGTPFTVLDGEAAPPTGYDIIASTCPCAGLSLFNTSKVGSPVRAKANYWMRMTCDRVLSESKPAVYFGENAPGLFTNMGRDVSSDMVAAAQKYGYGLTFFKTSTYKHGAPQRRPRTFYFFWRGGEAPKLPFFSVPPVPARDFLGEPGQPFTGVIPLSDDSSYQFLRAKFGDDWRRRDAGEFSGIMDMLVRLQLLREYVATGPKGDRDFSWKTANRLLGKLGYGGVFSCMPIFPKYGETYPSVIAKNAKSLVHPVEDRFLTYEEAADLMGLPRDFPLPPQDKFNIICQNVPTMTARDVTTMAKSFVNGELESTGSQVTWVDNISQKVFYGPGKSRKNIHSIFMP